MNVQDLKNMKAEFEAQGISKRRIQCRLVGAVKAAGMVDGDLLPTKEGQDMVKEALKS